MSAEHDPARGSDQPAAARDDDFLDRPVENPPYDGEGGAEPAVVEPPAPTSTSTSDAAAAPAAPAGPASSGTPGTYGRSQPADSRGMLPARDGRRSVLERMLVRLIATCGIIGIGVAIAAIMVSSKSQGWVVGLVVSIVSVILAALLWSSDRL
jgi:hypothetical protein